MSQFSVTPVQTASSINRVICPRPPTSAAPLLCFALLCFFEFVSYHCCSSTFLLQVATVGPASHTFEQLESLFLAGVDVFRLNFSHGFHEEKAEVRYGTVRYQTKRNETERSRI